MAGTRVQADRLRLELARRGWDGCDLATAAGVSCATVSAAIRGRPISTVTLRKMVLALSRAPVLPGVDELVCRQTAASSDSRGSGSR
jgi:transcriptional regulator with XRE-family HTH domain